MTYSNRLRYAGAKPFHDEQERLPYQIFEALSTTDNMYDELAEVRWLAYELEDDLDSDDEIPTAVHEAVFAAADGRDGSLRVAVDAYVAEWLADRATWLVEEWGINREAVNKALDEYDVDIIGGSQV